MKKIISAILVAVMLLSVVSIAVSAKSIFKQPDGTTSNGDVAIEDKVDEEKKEDDKKEEDKKPEVFEPYVPTTAPAKTMAGGKYIKLDEAGAELENYFKANTYKVRMFITESRVFSEDCYFYSVIPAVVSYNYKTGELIAKDRGTTDVYVFTKGGVPLLKLAIEVVDHYSYDEDDMADRLNVSAEAYNLPEWKYSSLKTTAVSGEVYEDIEYAPVFGENHIGVDGTNGGFLTYKEGVAIIRAYRDSDPEVYGETIVFAGKYNSAIRSGKWFAKHSVFYFKDWCYDIATPFTYVTGWIKTPSGTLIPVVSTGSTGITRFYYANSFMKSVVTSIGK